MSGPDLAILKAQLTAEEGYRLKPYRDSRGILTIGIGHNLEANGISDAVAEMLFIEDVEEAMKALDAYLPWWQHLDEVRARVLVDLCFNMGIKTLLTFKHTLSHLELGNYAAAADGLAASLWHTQVGKRAPKLEQMLRTGKDLP